MENLDKIKKLRRNVVEIRTLCNVKIPRWKEDVRHYDKTGWGFNKDDRFSACKAVPIAFSSHMGTYGDSGCSSQMDLDYEIFSRHLIDYLNKNKQEIMLSIADQIEKEAADLKSKAEAELNTELEKLKELE